jgi:hypothetical protein
MECPRGSIVTESTHTVKTLDKARDWFDDITSDDLPITVNQFKSGNGRLRVQIYNNKGRLIHNRG